MWNEVQINSVNGVYDPKKAIQKAYVRRYYAKYQGKKIVGNELLRVFVDTQLLFGQSPEAISGRMNYSVPSGRGSSFCSRWGKNEVSWR